MYTGACNKWLDSRKKWTMMKNVVGNDVIAVDIDVYNLFKSHLMLMHHDYVDYSATHSSLGYLCY